MAVHVRLVAGPLARTAAQDVAGAGAVLCFDGVVRPLETDRLLVALDYESYEPMTSRELARLAHEVAEKHQLLSIRVEHSTGRVPVGETSFRLEVAAEHRGPALRAQEEFVERLKREIPLWKVPVFADPADLNHVVADTSVRHE